MGPLPIEIKKKRPLPRPFRRVSPVLLSDPLQFSIRVKRPLPCPLWKSISLSAVDAALPTALQRPVQNPYLSLTSKCVPRFNCIEIIARPLAVPSMEPPVKATCPFSSPWSKPTVAPVTSSSPLAGPSLVYPESSHPVSSSRSPCLVFPTLSSRLKKPFLVPSICQPSIATRNNANSSNSHCSSFSSHDGMSFQASQKLMQNKMMLKNKASRRSVYIQRSRLNGGMPSVIKSRHPKAAFRVASVSCKRLHAFKKRTRSLDKSEDKFATLDGEDINPWMLLNHLMTKGPTR
jgi:hypothetical protein